MDKQTHKPVAGQAECVVRRHNSHSLPHAFFVWLGETPLAGPMQENSAMESAVAISAALKTEREKRLKVEQNHNKGLCYEIQQGLREQLAAELLKEQQRHDKDLLESRNKWEAAIKEAADKAVEPYREALEFVRDNATLGTAIQSVANDTLLVKHREGK